MAKVRSIQLRARKAGLPDRWISVRGSCRPNTKLTGGQTECGDAGSAFACRQYRLPPRGAFPWRRRHWYPYWHCGCRIADLVDWWPYHSKLYSPRPRQGNDIGPRAQLGAAYVGHRARCQAVPLALLAPDAMPHLTIRTAIEAHGSGVQSSQPAPLNQILVDVVHWAVTAFPQKI
jgi:hypothetical protein